MTNSPPKNCLGLFAKLWEPGQVKTRLAKTLGDQRAAEVYYYFIQTLITRLGHLADARYVAISPAAVQQDFRFAETSGWKLVPQVEGSLGQRLERFLHARFDCGFRKVVVLGTDSPDLPVDHVNLAFRLLDEAPVVLGPTEDGGYWLLGVADRVPPIFTEIPWSTPQVWSSTLDRLKKQKIAFRCLPTWYDVDEMPDLERLVRSLESADSLDPALEELARNLRE